MGGEMSDEPAETPEARKKRAAQEKIERNPYKWVTPKKFREFMEAKGVSMKCELCTSDKSWWIDTGHADGYVARLPAMPQLPDGRAATSDTFQMPVVRAVCLNCGNVRLHAVQAMDIWRKNGNSLVIAAEDEA